MPERLLDAAYDVFLRRGLRRSTMSEVAEAAGVGRATLYRYFPSKERLVQALVLREAQPLFALLHEELATEDAPDRLLERGLLAALAYLRSHKLLMRTLREEPEAILPELTVRGAPLLEAAVDFATPYVERAVKTAGLEGIDARAAAEWAARVLLSLVLTPSVVVDLDNEDELRRFIDWLVIAARGGSA